MKVLVIDNSEHAREALIIQLELFCKVQAKDIAQADGVSTGLNTILEFKPDVVFLDVEMDDGTGIELLSKLEKIEFQLIFVTAYNKYAVDAFRFSAIDYLLKPVDPDKLQQSYTKAKTNIEQKDTANQLKVLEEELLYNSNKKIVLRNSDAIFIVKVSEIIHCKADAAYTHFFLTGDREILVSKRLKEYEELLSPFHFVRVHHSHLVNLNKVIRFDKADGGMLVLEGEISVSVSQRKKEHVLNLINSI